MSEVWCANNFFIIYFYFIDCNIAEKITSDGGVLKKIITQGSGTVPPKHSVVFGTHTHCYYNFSSFCFWRYNFLLAPPFPSFVCFWRYNFLLDFSFTRASRPISPQLGNHTTAWQASFLS
jgi:hypothetical protein